MFGYGPFELMVITVPYIVGFGIVIAFIILLFRFLHAYEERTKILKKS